MHSVAECGAGARCVPDRNASLSCYHATQLHRRLTAALSPQVPEEYANLPQLLGRATLEMNYTIKESRDSQIPVTHSMTIVVDGYNAPVSAGCFVDLVNKKWYDGMEIQRADGFVVQTGKPEGKQEFYLEPDTGKPRVCAASPASA
jgi:peptidylprolyl isomerase